MQKHSKLFYNRVEPPKIKTHLKKINGVIWDVDGTLLDSEPLHFEALQFVSQKYGFVIDEEMNAQLLGMNLDKIWEYLQCMHSCSFPRNQWIDDITDYYLKKVDSSMARPGTIDCIKKLKKLGIPQACVSTAGRKILDANLKALAITHYMHFSLGFEDVTHTKPSPEPYLKACQLLNISPANCIAIEDTQIGVESASRAGLITIAWPHPMSLKQNLKKADQVIKSLAELPWNNIEK